MGGLFSRERAVLNEAQGHLRELGNGTAADAEQFKNITDEYALLLEQQQQILDISDKASMGLLNDKRTRQEKIAALENELLQNKISIMLSQIQPHFIFNSLNAIKGLCLIEPLSACETIDEFSSYLRGNLDSLSIKEPVYFDKELEHVKAYLALEKKRFGDKLKIIYDIGASNFLIPVLTLQPIIENAVRHGVTKCEDGGTVTVRTEETEAEVLITVIDDGVGFEPEAAETGDEFDGHGELDERDEYGGHGVRITVGIDNVRSRLKHMCGGTLDIHSKPDAGTTVTIKIPKEF